MRYLSVCSGIEAATVAWEPLGWIPAGFSEIDDFPRAVLTHHYPGVPLYGDFTQIQGNEPELGAVDLLVGGTPCQSFSMAGFRLGIDDPRGNLALGFMQLAQRVKPRWVIWENVPGVLSSNGGRDFGSILGALVELGYGFAYRVLDAQFFGVPQRRRRVFVVGCLGSATNPARVLLEQGCLQGDNHQGRKKKVQSAANRSGCPEFSITAFDGYNYKVADDGTAYTITTSTRHYRNLAIESYSDRKFVRRLTPSECEKLQGFPSNYTKISWNGKQKEECPDSQRYKAVGNSMAVPVMKWIGTRIDLLEKGLL